MTLARFKSGDGQVAAAQHAADAPIVLAGQMGISRTFLAERDISALVSKGAPKPLERYLDVAQNKLHLRKVGAAVNPHTIGAGHFFWLWRTLAGDST